MGANSNLPAVRAFGDKDALKRRIAGLVDNSTAFINSVISIVSNDTKLQKCSADSIWSAAVKSAGVNLPVNPELGQAYIVPYGSTAQLIIGYKGILQLAIRTGQYRTIKAVAVYEDEIKYFNPITEEFEFDKKAFAKYGQRNQGGDPVGYYAFLELKSGYRATKYMSRQQVEAHAEKYSQAYAYDKRAGKKVSPWSTEFEQMAKKTLLRLLLSQQGMLSIDVMQSDGDYQAQPVETPAEVIEAPEQPEQPRQQDEPPEYAEAEQVEVPFQ